MLVNKLAEKLGLKASTDDAVLDAVSGAVDAQGKLKVLCKALGTSDAESAIEEVTELLRLRKASEKDAAELEQLRKEKAARSAAEEEADVDQVIASRGLPEETKDALLLLRRNDPKKFAEKFPKPRAGEENLGKVILAGGDKGDGADEGPGAKRVTTKVGAKTVDLSGHEGRNDIERLCSWVRENEKGAKDWPYDRVFQRACAISREMRKAAGE